MYKPRIVDSKVKGEHDYRMTDHDLSSYLSFTIVSLIIIDLLSSLYD